MNTSAPARVTPPPAWRLWENPIFRRFCRSRLRARGLMPALVIVLIVASFAYIVTPLTVERTSEWRRATQMQFEKEARSSESGRRNLQNYMEMQRRLGLDPAELHSPQIYQRSALLPLLALQALILFVLGTGQVAGGMTTERDEGMVDYQRLTPMTPLAKVLGYLLGLPVREWVLFLATLPFTALALWRGEVPFDAWAPVALVLLTSVILYHLTGLTTGTVMKSRRWAFLLCMGVIFLLYFVVPQSSRFGLPFMRYVTMWPVLMESAHLFPAEQIRAWRLLASAAPGSGGVPFFGGPLLSPLLFTLIVQGSFILTLLVMVWRKWRQTDSHLLSKAWALLVFGWLVVLQMGMALPGIRNGTLFPTSLQRVLHGEPGAPRVVDAFLMCVSYGVLLLLLLTAFITMLTPTADAQSRGLRRAAKLGRSRAPFFADESSAFPVVFLLTVGGAAAWAWFTRSVLGSHWFQEDPGNRTIFVFLAVLAPAALGFHALLEARAGKWPFLAVVFIGVVPLLAAVIILASGRSANTPATMVAGASPLAMTSYAVEYVMPLRERFFSGRSFHETSARALIVWSTVYSAGALALVLSLRRYWKNKRR